MKNTDRIIAEVATPQFGVFAASQVYERGVTRDELRSRVRNGHIERLNPKVYAIAGAHLSWHSLVKAAELWSKDGAASHRTACRLHDFKGIRKGAIEISSRRSTPAPKGFVCHHPKRLPDWQITKVDGIRTTNEERSLLDLCAIGKTWECADAVDSALRVEPELLNAVRHIIEVESKPGRTGIRLLRSLIAERDPSVAPPGSVLAGRFLRWLRTEGFPEPVAEFRVCGEGGFVKDIDFAYPLIKLGFEVDGYADHGMKRLFDGDRDGDTVLIGLGWRIMRITYAALTDSQKRLRLRNSVAAALQHHVPSQNRVPTPHF